MSEATTRRVVVGLAEATLVLLLILPALPLDAETAPKVPVQPGLAPAIEALAPGSATSLLGKKVRGPSGENLGMVVDVLAGCDGTPRAAVIDFGGFLGVGSRKIAVAWSLLHFQPAKRDAPIQLDVSRADVQSAPEYKDTKGPLQILASPSANSTAAADCQ